MAVVVFEGELNVQYGFGSLSAVDVEMPDLDDARSGQSNGLLGAGVPGALSLRFGLHAGPEPLRIEWSESEPPVGDTWEEVVEASVDLPAQEILRSTYTSFFLPVARTVRDSMQPAWTRLGELTAAMTMSPRRTDTCCSCGQRPPCQTGSCGRPARTPPIGTVWHGATHRR